MAASEAHRQLLATASRQAFYCVDRQGKVGLLDPGVARAGGRYPVPNVVGCIIGIFVALFILNEASRWMMTGLFGFGVPLEAVDQPRISFHKNNCKRDPLLADRAIVLNAPLALLHDLIGKDGEQLDLAQVGDKSLAFNANVRKQKQRLEIGQTVVVSGLDVALKDPTRRNAALTMLEDLSAMTGGQLVIMTDLSPLDRILQAYEREQTEEADGGEAGATITRTEQMRWSRLFEGFRTYSLTVQPKFKWSDDREKEMLNELGNLPNYPLDKDQRRGIIQLMLESRFLPERAIISLIKVSGPSPADRWITSGLDKYPPSADLYDDLYFSPMWEWAKEMRPATRAAAIDFMRGMLIEHYQHVWTASSHAERVILDTLAHGRVINIKSALAIRSLVRRGLVILDPAPGLFNESFAAFVRQAEKPEALNRWRSQQPKGAWDRIAQPLTYALPATIVALAALALFAGESFATVVPILLGAGPALLSTLGPARKATFRTDA
jgi:hypothetical protein